jgi:CRISPR/Cas system CSM-associated protein Csm4 (group 5 of RAMP superfamily)
LLLRITHKFKVDFVPEILVKKRIHNENESKNKINNIMATIVTIKDISNKLNVPEYKLKYNLSKYYMSIGYNYRKTNKLIAMKYYFLSLSYNVSSEQIRLIASLFGSMFNLRNSVIKKG